MPGYWWVNHKQTWRQEIEGQYLWSPKTKRNGDRNEFYINMRRASPGDRVLSYADAQIGYVGRVAEFAFAAPKPEEFGTVGANWSRDGWLLDAVEDAIEMRIIGDLTLDDTEKQSLIAARRGQGVFRSNLEKIERACRLTGITNPSLLKASHVKPWRACETAEERLDGMNGLLLTPDADHLFDRGFISFGDEGEVLVSTRVGHEDLRRLGFDQLVFEATGLMEAPANWRTNSFLPGQRPYLDYHRREVFLSE
jgi:HNH endonuclease